MEGATRNPYLLTLLKLLYKTSRGLPVPYPLPPLLLFKSDKTLLPKKSPVTSTSIQMRHSSVCIARFTGGASIVGKFEWFIHPHKALLRLTAYSHPQIRWGCLKGEAGKVTESFGSHQHQKQHLRNRGGGRRSNTGFVVPLSAMERCSWNIKGWHHLNTIQ